MSGSVGGVEVSVKFSVEFSLYGRRAPSPKKKIVLSLVYMGGEHRAQTGI